MKQFPLSPYHQFSNSSLNSDFYDRYLSHDGHQPLQTPLIGIERTQDLLSLKLPPHGPDEQDSQRFPKEWSFADDTKQHVGDEDDHDSDHQPRLPPSSRRDKLDKSDKSGKEKKNAKTSGGGGATGESSKGASAVGLSKPTLLSQQQQQQHHHHHHHHQLARDGAGLQHQPTEVSTGFFFRYNRSNGSPSVTSKSSRQSQQSDSAAGGGGGGGGDANAADQRRRQQSSSDDDEDNSKAHDIFAESMKHFNPLNRNQTNAVADSDDGVCYDLRSKNSSPQPRQSGVGSDNDPDRGTGGGSDAGGAGGGNGGGSQNSDTDNATSMSQQYHGQESCFGLDPSKQRFQYVLAAPISVATKLNEDTMTYLNQGQAYEIKLGNVTDVAEARKGFMCSIINIGFHERHMQQAENELWQQWSHQHPNEKIFSVDMKLSYNVYGVDSDGLNKYEFLWDSSKAAGVFIRINSISTEFTPKKHGGEKGVPFRLSIETFSYNSKTHDSYFISAASCQIKVFKPKGAERKIRSDRDKIYKRPPSEQEKYHRSCDHTTFSECSLTSLHPTADSSLCYYRHSHGHFASKQGSTTTGGTGTGGGSASSSGASHHGQTSGSGHNSDDELEQTGGMSQRTNNSNQTETNGLDQNQQNRSSATANTEEREGNSSPNSDGANNQHNHQHHLNNLKLSLQAAGEVPYTSASSVVHHRLSSVHHSYRHHDMMTSDPLHHINNEANSFSGNNHATSTNQPTTSSNSEVHHQSIYSSPGSSHHQAAALRGGLPGGINSAAQHFHGMTAAHYYSHPLPGALVPPHHMTPTPGYGISAGPMSHPAAAASFPPLSNHHHHPGLQDVKSSIYRHHQLVGADKPAFSQHAATAAAAAMTASYGAAAAFKSHHHHHTSATNLGQLNTNYQSYFATSSSSSSAATAPVADSADDAQANNESLPHDTKDHHHHQHHQHQNSPLANNNNNNSTCYNNDTYTNTTTTNSNSNNQSQLHSLRQRSASTSLASANNHCQNPYARHHLDNYFTSSANNSGSNENLSSSSQNNNNVNAAIPHANQSWGTQGQNNNSSSYGNPTGSHYTDCCNIQTSETPSSCCSRYKNVDGQAYMSSQSNESVIDDIKCPTSSAHITINSNCMEVVSWFASNRFGVLAKTFNNFSGADLLRLSKTELIEICGLIEGIRLFNSLHNQPIKPRRVLYICLETDDIYHPVYLYDLTLDELLGEISLILETNSSNQSDENDASNNHQSQAGKTSSSSSGSSSDSRSSSRPLSAEINDDEVYQNEPYYEDMHGSCSNQDNNLSSDKSPALESPDNNSMKQQQHHQISRLLVDGVASVKVAATEKVVQMLEDESVWTLSVQTRLSGAIEACITACRAHKRHCK